MLRSGFPTVGAPTGTHSLEKLKRLSIRPQDAPTQTPTHALSKHSPKRAGPIHVDQTLFPKCPSICSLPGKHPGYNPYKCFLKREPQLGEPRQVALCTSEGLTSKDNLEWQQFRARRETSIFPAAINTMLTVTGILLAPHLHALILSWLLLPSLMMRPPPIHRKPGHMQTSVQKE